MNSLCLSALSESHGALPAAAVPGSAIQTPGGVGRLEDIRSTALLATLAERQVESRNDEQGKQGANQHARCDHQANTEATVGAGAAGDNQGLDAQYGGEGSHQDRAQSQ